MGSIPQEHIAGYSCSVCGLAVIVLPSKEMIKACGCSGSVLANLHASIAGIGGLL